MTQEAPAIAEIEIRTVSIDLPNPAPYNPRKDLKPSDPEYKAIKRSLKEFGNVGTLVWNEDTGNLVGGHQRIKVLKAEGIKEISVHVVHLDEDKEALLNLALNKVKGADDIPKMKDIIFELEGRGVDVSVAGFSTDDIASLLNRDKEATSQDDVVPPAPEVPRSKLGTVWEMGDHRLFVGSCTTEEAYKALQLDVHVPSMIFTDPPYGVSYKAKSGKFDVIKGDDARDDELMGKLLTPAFKLAAQYSEREAAFYVWHASSTRRDFEDALKAAGLMERQYLIWAKNGIVLGHSDYRWSHEPCFYASKQETKPKFYGDRAQPTVWRANLAKGGDASTVLGPGIVLLDGRGGSVFLTPRHPKTKSIRKLRLDQGQVAHIQVEGTSSGDVWEVSHDRDYKHPTQKPVELAIRAIQNSSRPGEVVLDPFLGSGTTIIGCEKTDRRGFGMELDPKYADVIVTRWENFTGRKAVAHQPEESE